MAQATCLRHLLEIRQYPANRAFFRNLKGCLGTAVGFKYDEDEKRFALDRHGQRIPAILVFVEEKIPIASLTDKQRVPETFRIPGGYECASDVMVGSAPNLPIDLPPLRGDNARIQRDLHEKDLGVIGGIPIESQGREGTAGCVVRYDRGTKTGILTNFHVAGLPGAAVVSSGGKFRALGHTVASRFGAEHTQADDDLEGYIRPTKHRIDVALVALEGRAADEAEPGVYGIRPLGPPFHLDLDTMEPIGTWVLGVGQTLGRQEGRIMAYGYEWKDQPESNEWCATDYLIISDSDQPFAAPGDSGKLVVTNDEERRPIALLWGGERHDFWNVPAQSTCAYATDIGLALRVLDAEILGSPSLTQTPQQSAAAFAP